MQSVVSRAAALTFGAHRAFWAYCVLTAFRNSSRLQRTCMQVCSTCDACWLRPDSSREQLACCSALSCVLLLLGCPASPGLSLEP